MKVFIGADHAGFDLKEKLSSFLKVSGYEVEDLGAFEKDALDDYPDFVKPVAISVLGNPGSMGIVIGKSGQGEAICANRFRGIRAALWYGGSHEPIKLTREHNDANVLSLGAALINGEADILNDVKTWLETPFSGDERHVRRIAKLDM